MGIYLAAFGAIDAQGLNGANQNNCLAFQVLRANLGELCYIQNQNLAAEFLGNCFAVGMARILQRFQCLPSNRIGRDKP